MRGRTAVGTDREVSGWGAGWLVARRLAMHGPEPGARAEPQGRTGRVARLDRIFQEARNSVLPGQTGAYEAGLDARSLWHCWERDRLIPAIQAHEGGRRNPRRRAFPGNRARSARLRICC